MDIYFHRKFAKNLRILFCQLKICALTHRNDSLDFGKVFKEFILPKLLFQHGQGRQNIKQIKAFYHNRLNHSGSR